MMEMMGWYNLAPCNKKSTFPGHEEAKKSKKGVSAEKSNGRCKHVPKKRNQRK